MTNKYNIPQWILPQSLVQLNDALGDIDDRVAGTVGIINHPDLLQLGYDESGHTGFASLTHDHELGGNVNFAQVVTVAKSGADFTDPRDAVNYANPLATSDYSRYVILCYPGVYDFGSTFLSQANPYITVVGISRKDVVFTSSNSSQTILTAHECSFVNLTIENSATDVLSDDFNDNDFDTNTWTKTEEPDYIFERNQRIEMVPPGDTTISMKTVQTFDDFDVTVQIYNPGATAARWNWFFWSDVETLGKYGLGMHGDPPQWGYKFNEAVWSNSGLSDWDTTPSAPVINVWYTFRLKKAGSSLEYYIDGVLVKTKTITGGDITASYNFFMRIYGNCYWDSFSVVNTGIYSVSASSDDTVYLHNCEINALLDSNVTFKDYEVQVDIPVKALITIDGVDISALNAEVSAISLDNQPAVIGGNVDFGDYDLTSIDKLEGVDANTFIDLGAAGIIEIKGDVGIGTASPGDMLEVFGNPTAHLSVKDNTGAFLQLWGDNEKAIIWNTSTALRLGTADDQDATSWAEKMRIDSSGNIGINVADPDTKLEILNAGTQLKLSYDGTNYFTFATQSDGDLTLDSNKTSYDFDLGDGNILTSGTVCGMTQVEIDQLENIGDITVSYAQWGYLGKMDQRVDTKQSPLFEGLTVQKDQNSPTMITVRNDFDDTEAVAELVARSDTIRATLSAHPANFTGGNGGAHFAGRAHIGSKGANGIDIIAQEAVGDFRVYTGGEAPANERIRISAPGVTAIGSISTTDYSEFEADGTLKFTGNATVFKDINMGAAVLTKPAATAPDEVNFVDEAGADTGIASLGFAIGEKVSGNFEMQHDYKEGSDITFHVHWQGVTVPAGGTDNVKWQLEYTIAQAGTTLNAITTIVVETTFDTQYEFKNTAFVAITGTNFNIEDQFLFTLTRIAASADDYAGDAIVATVGIHYELDTVGSRQILAK